MRHDNTVETFDVDGLTVRIKPDNTPESPREWDNLGTMVCWHRRYTLGDKIDGWAGERGQYEFQQWVDKSGEVALCLPLYLYDHSGITMNTSGFSCPWDSGQVGWIYVSRAKLRQEYGKKRISKKVLELARGVLVSEVKVYDQFLTGDVYGFVIEDSEGEHLDSCWGFYGLADCKVEATSAAQSTAKHIAAREAQVAQLLNTGFAL